MSEILFSITRKDFDVQFFRAGGPGGQNQNKVSSACRITHKASGAVGESRTHRSQDQNKKAALERLVASRTFQQWLKVETSARLAGFRNAEARVDAAMAEENLRVESPAVGKCFCGRAVPPNPRGMHRCQCGETWTVDGV